MPQIDGVVVHGVDSYNSLAGNHTKSYMSSCSTLALCKIKACSATLNASCQCIEDGSGSPILRMQLDDILCGDPVLPQCCLQSKVELNFKGLNSPIPHLIVRSQANDSHRLRKPLEVTFQQEACLRVQIGVLLERQWSLRSRAIELGCKCESWSSTSNLRLQGSEMRVDVRTRRLPNEIPRSLPWFMNLSDGHDAITDRQPALFSCALGWAGEDVGMKAKRKLTPGPHPPLDNPSQVKRSMLQVMDVQYSSDALDQSCDIILEDFGEHAGTVTTVQDRRIVRELERGNRHTRHQEGRRIRERERESDRLSRLLRRAAELDVSRCCNDVRTLLIAKVNCEEAGILVPSPPSVYGEVHEARGGPALERDPSMCDSHPKAGPDLQSLLQASSYFVWRLRSSIGKSTWEDGPVMDLPSTADYLHMVMKSSSREKVIMTVLELEAAIIFCSFCAENESIVRLRAQESLHVFVVQLVKSFLPGLLGYLGLHVGSSKAVDDLNEYMPINELTWPAWARILRDSLTSREHGAADSVVLDNIRGVSGWMSVPSVESADFVTQALMRARAGELQPSLPGELPYDCVLSPLVVSRSTGVTTEVVAKIPVPCGDVFMVVAWQKHVKDMLRIDGVLKFMPQHHEFVLHRYAEENPAELRTAFVRGVLIACRVALCSDVRVAARLGALRQQIRCFKDLHVVHRLFGLRCSLRALLKLLELWPTVKPTSALSVNPGACVSSGSSTGAYRATHDVSTSCLLRSEHPYAFSKAVRLFKNHIRYALTFARAVIVNALEDGHVASDDVKVGYARLAAASHHCSLRELCCLTILKYVISRVDGFGLLKLVRTFTTEATSLGTVLKRIESAVISGDYSSACWQIIRDIRYALSPRQGIYGEWNGTMLALAKLSAIFERLLRLVDLRCADVNMRANDVYDANVNTQRVSCAGIEASCAAHNVRESQQLVCQRCDAPCCPDNATNLGIGSPWFCSVCTGFPQGPCTIDGLLAETVRLDGTKLIVTLLALDENATRQSIHLVGRSSHALEIGLSVFLQRLNAQWLHPQSTLRSLWSSDSCALRWSDNESLELAPKSPREWSSILSSLVDCTSSSQDTQSALTDNCARWLHRVSPVSAKQDRRLPDLGNCSGQDSDHSKSGAQAMSRSGHVVDLQHTHRKQNDCNMVDEVIRKAASMVVDADGIQSFAESAGRCEVGTPSAHCDVRSSSGAHVSTSSTLRADYVDEQQCSLCGGDVDYLSSPYTTLVDAVNTVASNKAEYVDAKAEREASSKPMLAHEFCLDVVRSIHANTHARLQQRSSSSLRDKTKLEGFGRTLPLGRDSEAQLYWRFAAQPTTLFIQATSGKRSVHPMSSGADSTLFDRHWMCYQTATSIAQVVMWLHNARDTRLKNRNRDTRHAIEGLFPEAAALALQSERRPGRGSASMSLHTHRYHVPLWTSLRDASLFLDIQSSNSRGAQPSMSARSDCSVLVRGNGCLWPAVTSAARVMNHRVMLRQLHFVSWSQLSDAWVGTEGLVVRTHASQLVSNALHSYHSKRRSLERGLDIAGLLRASVYLNSPRRFSSDVKSILARIDVSQSLNSAYYHQRVLHAMLILHAALPEGSLRNVAKRTVVRNCVRILQSTTAVELMEVVLTLEDTLKVSWIDECWSAYRSVLPTRTVALKSASLSLVVVLIFLLDRSIKYDKLPEAEFTV